MPRLECKQELVDRSTVWRCGYSDQCLGFSDSRKSDYLEQILASWVVIIWIPDRGVLFCPLTVIRPVWSPVTPSSLEGWGPNLIVDNHEGRPAAALVGGAWSHLTNFGHIWPIFIIVGPCQSSLLNCPGCYLDLCCSGPDLGSKSNPYPIHSPPCFIPIHPADTKRWQSHQLGPIERSFPLVGMNIESFTTYNYKLYEEWSLQHINIKKQIQPILHYHQHVNRYIKWYKSAAIHRFANEARSWSRLGRDSRGSRERAPPWRPWWRWQQRAAGR